jgi:hypothetical protein
MADKTRTIKNATDKELDELLIRLRKESELQYLVSELRRKGMPDGLLSFENQKVSTEEPIENLYHVGVLGMKWGRRKGKTTQSRPNSEDHKESRSLKKNKVSTLSNAELRKLNDRLQLEKQYSALNPSKTQKGLNYVKSITAAGTTLAALYAVTQTPFGKKVREVVSEAVDSTVAKIAANEIAKSFKGG